MIFSGSLKLVFNNCLVYRCHRNSNTSSSIKGGGVLLTVNNKLFSKLLRIFTDKLEVAFVLFRFSKKNIILNSVYFPI